MACCGSRSWKAPIYFTMSVVLGFIAISTSWHWKPQEPTSPTKVASLQLSLEASKALRRAGFNAMATLLQVSPEIFLGSGNATIFALQDSAISNSSLPPWLLKSLLRYHTCPLNLDADHLLELPVGSCLPTLQGKKKVAVTRLDRSERLVEVNGVLVTHPDVFLGGTLSVHGVLDPFSPLDPEDVRQGWASIRAPDCRGGGGGGGVLEAGPGGVEWSSIVRLLSSEGFVPLAIGLNSVLDGILQDYEGLESVTIFAPPSLPSLASPSPWLERTVRFHVLPQRLTYRELTSLPVGALLMTLASGLRAKVTKAASFGRGVVVNGVEVVAPDILASERFIIHGISRAFEIAHFYDTPTV